ncbi:hypothetical protein [Roseateles sp. L2-2]|uniref:hypothetical protein n=1 Tax=Roseateles TaxID=93681 RepID=UPI003D369B2E
MSKAMIKAWLPPTILALVASLIDVVLIGGWAAAILVACWSATTLLLPRRHRHQRALAGFTGLFALLLTTVLGYGSASFVRSDFRSAARSFQSTPPATKSDLLAKDARMHWFTKYSLLSYTAATAPPTARFKIFPFSIEEYDLAGNRLRAGGYD